MRYNFYYKLEIKFLLVILRIEGFVMDLRVFHEDNKKKKIIILGGIIVFFLILGIILYRSYAIYQERKTFDVINDNVPDQNYDTMLSFYYEETNGTQKLVSEIPKGNYVVRVSCDKDAIGTWDYDAWGPNIRNVSQTRTKCKLIYFDNDKGLLDYGLNEADIVTSGSGLYKINHNGELFASSQLTEKQKAYLKLPEYRYAGKNPNNYVRFNDELWRIIGLVNTPEGQRLKIIRNESIGKYSWDSSDSSVNNGSGVNEWSSSTLMKLLNPGYELEENGGSLYWNRQGGNCYVDGNKATEECDFSLIGFNESSREMIDTNWWFTGYSLSANKPVISAEDIYNISKAGIQKVDDDDTLKNALWQGKVGLMAPYDYSYATSGSENFGRNICFNAIFTWNKNITDCRDNNWIYSGDASWLLNPWSHNNINFVFDWDGGFNGYDIRFSLNVVPSVYLKPNIKLVSGNGTQESPYELSV